MKEVLVSINNWLAKLGLEGLVLPVAIFGIICALLILVSFIIKSSILFLLGVAGAISMVWWRQIYDHFTK